MLDFFASNYQMVSYNQETNPISAMWRYIQDIFDEVLLTKTMVKTIILQDAGKLNSNNNIHPHLPCHKLYQLHNFQQKNHKTLSISSFFPLKN